MYIKFSPNQYVFRYRNGRIVSQGAGLSFFFFEKNTSACAIPVSGTEVDFIFEETTKDFQNVTVQGQLTCLISDYQRIADVFDFSVNLHNGEYLDKPIEKLTKRLINLAQVHVKNHIGNAGLAEAIQSSRLIATKVFEEIKNSSECEGLGIVITGLSILKIKANPETVRALEATTREEILKKSDDALYVRRNASIEQERKVKENELNTEISIEEKKKSIKETELQTRRMLLEGDSELKRIEIYSKSEREKIEIESAIELEKKRQELAELKLANAKKDADAEAYRIGAVMEAYNKLNKDVLVALATLNMEPERMIAQAFNQLANNAGKIGTLNISPELLDCLKVSGKK